MENIESLDPAQVAQVAFGKKVRDRRLSLDWTQKELAERISEGGVKMHQGTIAKIESGTRPTNVGELSVIAGAFRTSAARLVREDEWEQDDMATYLLLEKRRSQYFQARFDLRMSWSRFWESREDLEANLAEARGLRSNGDVASRAINSTLNHLISRSQSLLETDVNDYLAKANTRYGVRVKHGVDPEVS